MEKFLEAQEDWGKEKEERTEENWRTGEEEIRKDGGTLQDGRKKMEEHGRTGEKRKDGVTSNDWGSYKF